MKILKKIGRGQLILLTSATIVILCLCAYFHSMNQASQNYFQRPEYADLNMFRVKEIRDVMEENGLNLCLPGISSPLAFSAPWSFKYLDHYTEVKIEKGTIIICDFVNYSRKSWFGSKRLTVFEINGKEVEASVSKKCLAKLYVSALKQNGLEEQFREDFGKGLTVYTAAKALKAIDYQLYKEGILYPGAYPFDRGFWEAILQISVFLLPIILIAASLFTSFLIESIRYNNYLEKYNHEHIGKWNDIAGTLPEFTSLRESGIRMDVTPHVTKPSISVLIKQMFMPRSDSK